MASSAPGTQIGIVMSSELISGGSNESIAARVHSISPRRLTVPILSVTASSGSYNLRGNYRRRLLRRRTDIGKQFNCDRSS